MYLVSLILIRKILTVLEIFITEKCSHIYIDTYRYIHIYMYRYTHIYIFIHVCTYIYIYEVDATRSSYNRLLRHGTGVGRGVNNCSICRASSASTDAQVAETLWDVSLDILHRTVGHVLTVQPMSALQGKLNNRRRRARPRKCCFVVDDFYRIAIPALPVLYCTVCTGMGHGHGCDTWLQVHRHVFLRPDI